jgi:hypothetical protein
MMKALLDGKFFELEDSKDRRSNVLWLAAMQSLGLAKK